jgi:aryl-alcohol dehydrogenase-like predicted oxidoreductase
MFTAQLAQSRALLGEHLALYQVHSVTADSGLFTDAPLLTALARLRTERVIIGVTASGPGQAETVRRVLELTVDGQLLVTSAQVTCNLLEPSVGPAAAEAAAAGWAVLVKEAVANGRLTPAGGPPAPVTALAALTVGQLPALDLAASPRAYWAARAARPWH